MCVLIFWTAFRGSQKWITNLGVRPREKKNPAVGSGTLQTLYVPGNREWANPKSNRCSVALTVRGSSTKNLCHQDKLSIKILSGSPWKTQEKGGKCATRHCTHLDAAPRQRPMSHGSFHQWIFSRKNIPVVRHSPYSPDLSTCDFILYSWLKNHLKGRHFGTLDNIQKRVTDELKGIPAEAFQHCYEQWKQRLRRCVAAQGTYFEGDNLNL